MALSNVQVAHLWGELEALGPAFIIDKAHDFGGDRTGKLDAPPQISLGSGKKAQKSFLKIDIRKFLDSLATPIIVPNIVVKIIPTKHTLIVFTTPVKYASHLLSLLE